MWDKQNSYSPDLPTDFTRETEEESELLTALSCGYVNNWITKTSINSRLISRCLKLMLFVAINVFFFKSCTVKKLYIYTHNIKTVVSSN